MAVTGTAVMGRALVLASGYRGPAQLTLPRAITSWTFDPWACAIVMLLGLGYLAGVRRVRRSGQTWPRARLVSFLGVGLGTLVVATMWWTGVYSGVLFYARAAQTILVLLLAPLFLALGRPLSLLIAAVGPERGQRVDAAVHSRAARVATFPAFTTLVLVGMPFVVYFSPWYSAYFHSGAMRALTWLALLAAGYVFFWTLLRVDPVPKAYPYLVALWITSAEVIGDAILGIAVIGDSHIIGSAWYHALARPWGPSLRFDQMLGGGTLWVIGDLIGLPFLVTQLIQMIREDESEAAVIDAELDARDAVAAGPVPAAAGEPATVPADQPWWQSDPRFTSRFSPAETGDQPPG